MANRRRLGTTGRLKSHWPKKLRKKLVWSPMKRRYHVPGMTKLAKWAQRHPMTYMGQ